ncbi:MAG: ABC transporter ATP-binding protein [Halothiobacillaceae bacterium]
MMDALEIRGLTKTYRSGTQALAGIDLTVPAGDFFALLGPNGAGKTTTIGVLSSLVTPTAGEVRVFGHDLARERARVKSLMGLVPQEFNFNGFEPVEEIVRHQAGFYGVARGEARRRTAWLLQELGLADKARSQARQLSGGMKRRLMIARALAHRPRLLILDEPTAGVDVELRRGMWDFLTRLNREEGVTILLTTHYLEEAEALCRHVAIIDGGQIVVSRPLREMLEQLPEESFVLDLVEPIAQVPVIPGVRLHRVNPGTLELEVRRGQPLDQVFAALHAAGVRVMSLRNKSNRLEALFMKLTGHGVEDEA